MLPSMTSLQVFFCWAEWAWILPPLLQALDASDNVVDTRQLTVPEGTGPWILDWAQIEPALLKFRVAAQSSEAGVSLRSDWSAASAQVACGVPEPPAVSVTTGADFISLDWTAVATASQ